MKKRLVALLLLMVLVLAFTACSLDKGEDGKIEGIETATGNAMSNPDVQNFYKHVGYKIYKDNSYASVTPVCGISMNIDVNKYMGASNEYKIGDEYATVKVTKQGEIGALVFEFQPTFEKPEGLNEQEVTINGMSAIIGTVEGADTWDYIWFTGDYEGFHVVNMGADWLKDDYDEFMDMLDKSLVLVRYKK